MLQTLTYSKFFLSCGAALGGLGVILGAFAAHLLKSKLTTENSAIFETAVRYQMYHAFILVVIGILMSSPNVFFVTAGWCFLVGSLVFSGSLYTLVLTGIRTWGAVTPVGGVFLVVGWGILLLGALKK